MPGSDEHETEFIARVQAEITTEAELLRQTNPELAKLEKKIEVTWKGLAPQASSSTNQHLLEQVEKSSIIDVSPPLGGRFGTSQVKRIIRKAIRWYFFFIVKQLNALHHFQAKLLSELSERTTSLERQLKGLEAASDLADPLPEADDALCAAIVASLDDVDGPIAVVTCGSGPIVASLANAGKFAHGVDESGTHVLEGSSKGLDLRVAAPLSHLSVFADSTLGAVVFAGTLERQPIAELVALADEALRCIEANGAIVVALADPSRRTEIESALFAGKGLSTAVWKHLLERRGCVVETVEVEDSRVDTIVCAHPE